MQSLSVKDHRGWQPAGQVYFPSSLGIREPFGIVSPVRQGNSGLLSQVGQLREKMIANVDPIPSANDNLMLVRGICNSALRFVKRRAFPFARLNWRQFKRVLKAHADPKLGVMTAPVTLLALAVCEGTALWMMGMVASMAQKASSRPIEVLMVMVAAS